MKTMILILLLLAVSELANAVQVNGFCYLEGQQSHGGTKVKFIKVSPSAVTDSTMTLADGSFTRVLVPGIYNIQYSRMDYQTQLRTNYLLIADSTLADAMLIRPLIGALNQTIGPGFFSVIGNIAINPGESLIIMPGTTIEFDSAFSFNVQGTLQAQGTVTDSIIFYGDSVNQIKKWKGVRLRPGSSQSVFAYCAFRNTMRADSGGALYLQDTSPEFSNCLVSGNRAQYVGYWSRASAVYGQNCTATFIDCEFSYNNSDQGGCLYFMNSSPSFERCEFRRNQYAALAAEGGGTVTLVDCIFEENGTAVNLDHVGLNAEQDTARANTSGISVWLAPVQMLNCFIANNTGAGLTIAPTNGLVSNCVITQNGHGIDVWENSGVTTISQCRISRNRSLSSGYAGGVNCNRSSAHFVDCQIDSNNSQGGGVNGGAVVCSDSAAPVFENCTFVRDSTTGNGGGLYCDESSPSFINCSFVECYATGYGDAMYLRNTECTINSSILYGQGNECLYFLGSMNSHVQYCDFSGWQQPFMGDPWYIPPALGLKLVTNANGDSADIYLNIFQDPMFVDVSNSNFNVQEGSPGIDAGDPNLPLDVDGTIADMGAFYFLQDITVTPRFLDFGVVPVLNQDTMSVVVRNAVDQLANVLSINLSDPNFQFDIVSGDMSLAQGDSLVLEVLFRPQASGQFIAQLMIVSDAQVNDTLYVGLSGEGGITPAQVTDLTILTMGGDALLNWSPVDSTTYGSPLSVDAYLVYFAESTDGPFWFHGLTTDTFYVHPHAVQFASEMYYHVSAFVGDIETAERIVRSHNNHITCEQLIMELKDGLWHFPPKAREVLLSRPELRLAAMKKHYSVSQ